MIQNDVKYHTVLGIIFGDDPYLSLLAADDEMPALHLIRGLVRAGATGASAPRTESTCLDDSQF